VIELTAGQVVETVVAEDLTRTRIVQYAGASGDFNPLHTDEIYAKEIAGYSGVFAHGMLTMGMTARALTDLVGEDGLHEFGVRFTAQVWPGDTLTVRTTVDRVDADGGEIVAHLSVATLNAAGTVVLSGHATARLRGCTGR
jgi:acyl dehydratase